MIIEKLDKAHISYSAGSPRRIVVKRYPDGRLSSGPGISGDNNRWNTVHTVGAIIIQSPISARVIMEVASGGVTTRTYIS